MILAIAMLAILSILGAIALTTTSTELRVTGNYQDAKQTFYTADRAVEYATSRDLLMTMTTAVNLADGGTHQGRIEAGGGGELISGTVTDLGPSDLPAKIAGAYGTDFGANLYHVSVEVRSDATAVPVAQRSQARIDAEIVRLFKNDDESIFRTTGGGG